jgi:transposase-like protein
MKRPDLDTLACVNPECHLFRAPGKSKLIVRQVYGPDRIRLLRCRICGEEFSERRGTAVFNTKVPEATAAEVINYLAEGCSVRATARLVQVATATVARLFRVAGCHAERFHDQHVHDLTPRVVEFDEQWSVGKKSRSGVSRMRGKLVICGTTRRWRQTAHWWEVWWWASGPKRRPERWCLMPSGVSGRGLYR